MVEFALSFLLFLVVFLGTMEFGRGVWTYTTVTHAARQGARFAMVRGTIDAATEDQVRAIVRQNAVGLNDSDLSVATTWSPDRERGSLVEVRVQYPFRSIVGALVVPSSQLQISSSAHMIISQ
jgi:Flp pilus assembly protein TadG